ncbi:MAG: FkbM family methyltransferase [Halobacteriota archaeon]
MNMNKLAVRLAQLRANCRHFTQRLWFNFSYNLLGPIDMNIIRHRRALSFFSQFISPGDLCFDIGANRGYKTKIFLELGANVVAVEPQEACIPYLERLSTIAPLHIIPKGVGDSEGKELFYICKDTHTISTCSEEWQTGRFAAWKWNERKLIPVTTLDTLISEFGVPTFCKIDVEGFENRVLQGLSQPLPYISFEFTKEFIDQTDFCIDYLVALGHRYFNYTKGDSMALSCQTWITPEELKRELHSTKDPLSQGDVYVKH